MRTSRPRSLPVALVGFGGAGSGIHAPLVASHTDLDLAVVVTRDRARARAATRRFPGAAVTDRLDDARRCVVAIVALPPPYRADVVDRLLDLGLRVVVEKPLGWDLSETERLISRGGDRITVFFNRRWDSDFLTLRRLRDEGTWTSPVRLVSRMQWWMPEVRDGWRNRAPGGGVLTEVATHLIDQAVQLLGPITDVYAELDARRPGARAEDDVFLALRHDDGSLSHLAAGPLGAPRPRFGLVSPASVVTLGDGDVQHDQLRRGRTPRDADWGIPDATTWTVSRGGVDHEPVRPERGRWSGFYDEVVAWARGGRPPVSADSAIAAARVVDAARAYGRGPTALTRTEGGDR